MNVAPLNARSPQCVMGFDFGMKRIGVAVGETAVGIAHAVETIHAESNADKMKAVDVLIGEWQPTMLVIGEPAYEDAREPHPVAHLARKFGNRLQERHRLPVTYINEFLSSHEAGAQLAELGIKGRAQKNQLDAMSAQVILQSYLDTLSAQKSQQPKQTLKARDAA